MSDFGPGMSTGDKDRGEGDVLVIAREPRTKEKKRSLTCGKDHPLNLFPFINACIDFVFNCALFLTG